MRCILPLAKRFLGIALALYVLLLAALVFFKDVLLYPGSCVYRDFSANDPAVTEDLKTSGWTHWTALSGEYLGLEKCRQDARVAWLIFYGNGNYALNPNSEVKG